jgi:hypothetical protein
MKELWNVFIEARTKEIKEEQPEHLEAANSYIHSFEQHFPLKDEQKEMMKHILLLLFAEKKSFNDFSPFLAFLFPMEHIQKSKEIHESLVSIFSTVNISFQKEKIIQCFKENEIPDDILVFLQKNPYAKETYLFILGFSYLYNENSTFAPEQRTAILLKYRTHFSTENIRIPKKWFLIDDFDLLKTYEIILSEMKTNSLLRLAFLITSREEKENLSSFISEIEAVYEEIRVLMASLYEQVQLAKEKNYANA